MGHGLMAPTQVPLGGARYGTTIAFLCPLFYEFLGYEFFVVIYCIFFSVT